MSLVDVELDQGERTAVRATITLATPEHDAAPLLVANPVVPLIDAHATRSGTHRRGIQWPTSCTSHGAVTSGRP